jgi:hypothetical protein
VLGLLADHNILGQVELIASLLQDEARLEYWDYLELSVVTLAELGLPTDASDRLIWKECQARQLILITANRNAEGPDSLEATIRTFNHAACLPVFTIGDPDRVHRDRAYAHRIADKLLDYLFDLDRYRGTGRLFIP